MIRRLRPYLPRRGHALRDTWDLFVAFLVPGPVYRQWCRFVWRPLRYRTSPWAKSSCDTCPLCQAIEAERPGTI